MAHSNASVVRVSKGGPLYLLIKIIISALIFSWSVQSCFLLAAKLLRQMHVVVNVRKQM